MTDAEVTLKETTEAPSSIFSPALTVREGMPAGTGRAGAPQGTFRELTVLEQLPTQGAEADIFLVEAGGERSILKLYRHRLEPKLEILTRIAEISRANSRCFVVFKEVGFDEQTGRWYELLEYFPLGSLKDVPPDIKNSPQFVTELVSELTSSIHCLHGNGMVHCDIKPGNVLVRSLEPLDLVLTDFGISSLLASDATRKMTTLKGTPMYWAPEAFSRMVGRASDWWGLGMIALELLAGAHPFEGLSDSQIIHKLTLGNVEIPTVGPDFTLLLKGLLTKNDAKRWGYPELARWMHGERGIPVHYETQPTRAASSETPPFCFEGREFENPETLARAFCEREQTWRAGTGYLRYVRQWLESRMQFDEAVELGEAIGKLEADEVLFRFVNAHARCPFVFLGKKITVDNLRLFLGRVARMESGHGEGRIIRMMGDGSLLRLYDDYVRLSGQSDPLLHQTLLLMDQKTPAEQWICFEALHSPADYFWPDGIEPEALAADRMLALEALRQLRALPLKRALLEELQDRYVVPTSLVRALRSTQGYAEGAEELRGLHKRELLIPRGANIPVAEVEAMDHDAYVAKAMILCMGHTPAILKKLDAVLFAFLELPHSENELERTVLSHGHSYLNALTHSRIAAPDALVISRLWDVFRERRRLKENFAVMMPISGTGGAVVFWVMQKILGAVMTPTLRTLFVVGVIGTVLYALFTSNLIGFFTTPEASSSRPRPFLRANPFMLFVGLLFVGPFLLFERLLSAFPNVLPLLIGAALGCGGYTVFLWHSLKRNLRKIMELCGQSIR